MNVLSRRSLIKFFHWSTGALLLYFVFVEPDVSDHSISMEKTDALSTHAGMGALLGLIVMLWTIDYLFRGSLGRPGPKLKGWSKTAHPILNKGLNVGLPLMMATGLATGVAAPFLVTAFDLFPLNIPDVGNETIHYFAQEVHEVAFDGLLILIIAHAAFHVWRHYFLKDNALRLMVPKFLHKYL